MTGTLRVSIAAVLTFALVSGLSACADEPKPKELPSLTPSASSPSPSATSTKGLTDEQQVRAIYVGYATGLNHAEDLKPDERRKYLSQWLAEPVLTDRVKGIAGFLKAGYRTSGTPRPHVVKLTVDDGRAHLSACADETSLITKNIKTGERQRGSSGVWREFGFSYTREGWRITSVAVGKKKCVRK